MTSTEEARRSGTDRDASPPRIDILLTIYNGLPYLHEQIASLRAQTFENWFLWVRDDGSSDETVTVLEAYASSDDRIRLVADPDGATRLGAMRGFAWLLERVDSGAEYTMFCDADDQWLPDKIARTLDLMRSTERSAPNGEDSAAPTLIHTDLTVVDRELNVIADSLWEYQGLDPKLATFRRLLIQNCVTGCTVMINRPLRELACPIPSGAILHDWWVSLVASCFGRIAYLPTPTMLYRQHGGNDTGAHRYPRGLLERAQRIWRRLDDREVVRNSLSRTASQAAAFLEQFRERLDPETRSLLQRYAEIPECGPWERRIRLVELGTLLHRADRNLGLLLRA